MWGECGSCSGAGGKGGRRGKSSCLTRRLKVELIGFATVGGRARGSGMTQDLPPEPHCVNGVTVSKMGKMEGEQVWEWASDLQVETCQGQVGVRVCSYTRGRQ